MTELLLIAFFILSTYYFIKYLYSQNGLNYLIIAALFGFFASLTRYDAWFLIAFEALVIVTLSFQKRMFFEKRQAELIIFLTLSSFGILLWFLWDFLILADPRYFMDSIYSAHAQQLGWLARHQLPSYKNISSSLLYYSATSIANIGVLISVIILPAILFFLKDKKIKHRFLIFLILFVPFIFNVVSLYMGQDVIFFPLLTPKNYQWHLFNARYGMLMIAVSAIFFGYLYYRVKGYLKYILILIIFIQSLLYILNIMPIITLEDGLSGLSSAKVPVDVEKFLISHYDGGFVLLDDYSRTLSITRSTIPMQEIIYVGTKPYWQQSLVTPQRYVRWVIIQKHDAVYDAIYQNKGTRGQLYKYFQKVYTSNEILIFRRTNLK